MITLFLVIKLFFILVFNSSSKKIIGSTTVILTQMVENHTMIKVKKQLSFSSKRYRPAHQLAVDLEHIWDFTSPEPQSPHL